MAEVVDPTKDDAPKPRSRAKAKEPAVPEPAGHEGPLQHTSTKCPDFSAARGDYTSHVIHTAPEMCPTCQSQVPPGAHWPGV